MTSSRSPQPEATLHPGRRRLHRRHWLRGMLPARQDAGTGRLREPAASNRRRDARPAPAILPALALATLAMALPAAAAGAQDAEQFGERLSRMPVDLRTTSTISGAGSVRAELQGNELTITVRFSGLNGGVTAAHVHNAPVARRGGVAFPIDVGGAGGTAGEITDTVTLTDDQIAELRGERYYVQIHTETNPGGEVRGWLLRRD